MFVFLTQRVHHIGNQMLAENIGSKTSTSTSTNPTQSTILLIGAAVGALSMYVVNKLNANTGGRKK